MTERDDPIPAGHTPQHNPGMEPRPDRTPAQDTGDSTEFLAQLAGSKTDGTAYLYSEDVEPLASITMTDVYEGETDINQERPESDAESLDLLLETGLRDGETDDVMEAIQEGYTYVPPIDPPITIDADDPESIQIAAGTAVSANDGDFPENGVDTDHMRGDDMRAVVRQALRRDSSTSFLADQLDIATINGLVIVRGQVDDLDDTDNIVAVISDVPGVEEVRDETIVRGL
jgi:hypothetical protein